MDLICAYHDESSESSSDNETRTDYTKQVSGTPQSKNQIQSHSNSHLEIASSSDALTKSVRKCEDGPILRGYCTLTSSSCSNQDPESTNVSFKDSQHYFDASVYRNSSTDFFNLSSLHSKPVCSNFETGQTTVSENDSNFDSIQVPDGDFWSDFVPPKDLHSQVSVPNTSHDEYYRKQTMEYETPSSSSLVHRRSNQPCSPSDSQSRVFKRTRISNHPYSNPHIRKAEGGNAAVSSDINAQVQANQSSDKKKVFFIHSKVAPYLHTHNVFKSASKTCASWGAHNGAVNRLNWNLPNFSHLLATAGMDSKICGWNVWSSIDQCVFTFTCHSKAIRHVDWCQSGRSVFSCSFDRTAQITDVESGKSKAKLDHIGFVTAGSLPCSNPNLVATGTDNLIFLWDLRTPQAPVKHYTYKEPFGQVQDLAFISDDRELVSCADHVARDSADRSIMVWDVRSSAVVSNQVFQERYTCTRLKLHKDKSHFLAQTQGGYIALFSSSTPYRMEKNKRFGGHKLLGYHIGFDVTPDGKLVYSGSAEGGLHVYDFRSGKLFRKLVTSRDDVIMDVACHPVLPSVIASCTWGGSVKLWQ